MLFIFCAQNWIPEITAVDYFWIGYENPLEDPINGINKFLDNLIDEYLILRISKYQIFLKKLN